MGKRWGQGTYLINNCRFTGIWDGDSPLGSIEISFPQGRYYKGEINEEFEMHGQGELRFNNGTRFRGQFLNDQPSLGEMFYLNGDYYEGEFKNNARHGKGTYRDSQGGVVKGWWRANVCV
jgi:hypothetical protein